MCSLGNICSLSYICVWWLRRSAIKIAKKECKIFLGINFFRWKSSREDLFLLFWSKNGMDKKSLRFFSRDIAVLFLQKWSHRSKTGTTHNRFLWSESIEICPKRILKWKSVAFSRKVVVIILIIPWNRKTWVDSCADTGSYFATFRNENFNSVEGAG